MSTVGDERNADQLFEKAINMEAELKIISP
jgi:hypothetical protein